MTRDSLITLLTTQILAISLPHPTRVGIDGPDASGKTTLAGELALALESMGRPVIRASIDRFHNPREIRYRLGPDSPEGYYRDSFDLPALQAQLLDPLGPGGNRQIRTGLFDFRSDSASVDETSIAPLDAILIFDGVFLHRPELAGCWDFSVYLQVTEPTILVRAAQRDRDLFGSEAAVITRYQKKYLPAQRAYRAVCRPDRAATLIIDHDDPQNPGIIER